MPLLFSNTTMKCLRSVLFEFSVSLNVCLLHWAKWAELERVLLFFVGVYFGFFGGVFFVVFFVVLFCCFYVWISVLFCTASVFSAFDLVFCYCFCLLCSQPTKNYRQQQNQVTCIPVQTRVSMKNNKILYARRKASSLQFQVLSFISLSLLVVTHSFLHFYYATLKCCPIQCNTFQ